MEKYFVLPQCLKVMVSVRTQLTSKQRLDKFYSQ